MWEDIDTHVEIWLEKDALSGVIDPITRQHYDRDPRLIARKAEMYLKNSGLADTAFFGAEAEFFIFDNVRFDQNAHSGFYFIDAEEGFKYGFKWWLLPRTDRKGNIWMARGFGGQRLMVFPEEDLIAVFTGWEILKDEAGGRDLVNRILPAVGTHACIAQ